MASHRIPFVDLRPFVDRVRPGFLDDVSALLERTEFVEGATVRALEASLARRTSLAHVVATSSGTDALVLALGAVGLGAGARVALPDVTFWATFEAVVRVGATPVLVDIDPRDLHLDVDELVRAHRETPFDAVLFPHLFGFTSARLDELRGFCRAQGILLVEDAAQAFGVAREGGMSVVADALAATFSFYPAKVAGGITDGGAACFRDEGAAVRARHTKNHGRVAHYRFDEVGLNARMGSVEAAWLLKVLACIDDVILARRRSLARYGAHLATMADRFRLVGPPPGVIGNGYLVVIECLRDDPDAVAAHLSRAGIGSARTYPEPIHAQGPARQAQRTSDLSRSTNFTSRVLNLPQYFGISDEAVDQVADALARA